MSGENRHCIYEFTTTSSKYIFIVNIFIVHNVSRWPNPSLPLLLFFGFNHRFYCRSATLLSHTVTRINVRWLQLVIIIISGFNFRNTITKHRKAISNNTINCAKIQGWSLSFDASVLRPNFDCLGLVSVPKEKVSFTSMIQKSFLNCWQSLGKWCESFCRTVADTELCFV